jgi:hypothetical protein
MTSNMDGKDNLTGIENFDKNIDNIVGSFSVVLNYNS